MGQCQKLNVCIGEFMQLKIKPISEPDLNPEVKLNESFNPYHQNFIQDGDYILIKPFSGKSKTQKINRTKFDFFTQRDAAKFERTGVSRVHFLFEQINVENFQVRLERIHYGNIRGGKHCFLLSSLNGYPFRLNGQYALQAIISHGDRVNLFGNEIYFYASKSMSTGKELNHIKDYENTYDLKIIQSDIPIYIQGETGTGKTYLAKQLHKDSNKLGPLIHLNVSAFPQTLLESELFGYKKGSFTGAYQDKMGAIEAAKDGTLFIDEIDSLSIENQIKLLLFLDNRTYRSVGDVKERVVNTRLIFSSGRNLESLVKSGAMRSDFYYRITSGHCLYINSCTDDPRIIENFIEQFCLENKVSLTNECRKHYLSIRWRGNLRQLKGHLNKKMIAANCSKIDLCSLDKVLGQDAISVTQTDQSKSFEQIKRDLFKNRLVLFQGNSKLAARSLGVSIRTFRKFTQEIS